MRGIIQWKRTEDLRGKLTGKLFGEELRGYWIVGVAEVSYVVGIMIFCFTDRKDRAPLRLPGLEKGVMLGVVS